MMNSKNLFSSVTAGLIFASCGGGGGGSSDGHARVSTAPLRVAQELNITWDRKTVFDNIGNIRDGEDNWYRPFGFSIFGDSLDLSTAERVVSLRAKNNFIIAASAYHNALSVIDYASEEKEHKYTKFASFRINHNTKKGGLAVSGGDGSGGGIADLEGGSSSASSSSGSHVDSSSGASSRAAAMEQDDESCRSLDAENTKSLWEHKLQTARITADGRYVYALIKPRFDDGFDPRTATYGIFRTMTGYCGVNPYDAKSTNKIDSRGVELIELSSNDKMLAVYGKGKYGGEEINTIRIYNSTLTKILATQKVDSTRSFDFAFGDTSIVGVTDSVSKMDENGNITQSPKIFKRLLPDLKQYREANLPFLASKVIGTKDRVIALSKERGFVALFDTNLKMLKEIKVQLATGERISHASVSPNGKLLALAKIAESRVREGEPVARGELFVYEITGNDIVLTTFHKTGAVSALTFVNDETLAYSPRRVALKLKGNELKERLAQVSANSIITLRLSKHESNQDDLGDEVQSQRQILELGEFADAKKEGSVKTHGVKFSGSGSLISTHNDAVLAFRELGAKDKGYSLFKSNATKLDFADGSTANTLVKLGESNELVGFKLIDQNSFVTLERWKGLTKLYVKKIENGKLTNALEAAGVMGVPYDVKFSKNAERIFSIKKPLTDKFLAPSAKAGKEIYLVDVYTRNGNSIEKPTKEIPLEHMETHENAFAVNDEGSEFYSIGSGRLYKHSGDFKNSEPLSVRVPGASGVFYAKGLVFVTTDDGYFYTFSTNLDDKKIYRFSEGIKDIQGTTNYVVIASADNIFILQNGEDLKALKGIHSNYGIAKIDVQGDKVSLVTRSYEQKTFVCLLEL